jgi:hypothetical protein
MTELNDAHHTEAAQPTPEWPDTVTTAVTDPSVAAVMATLDGVPELHVSGHESVYSALHDALLHALNEDAPTGEGKA